jgi:hypothetical protein
MGLLVQHRFDGVRVPFAYLIAQEHLQYLFGFALDVDRVVIAGEGIAWHL